MSPKKDAGPSTPATPKPPSYVPMGDMRRDECTDLLKLVSGVTRPLEDVVADFLARVPPERRLRFGAAINFVLQDKMMLRPAERLIAFAILHQGYSLQLANPFVPLLINAACDETSEKPERAFLQILLSSANGDNNKELGSGLRDATGIKHGKKCHVSDFRHVSFHLSDFRYLTAKVTYGANGRKFKESR